MIYVVHHFPCYDGFCAAWILSTVLKDDGEEVTTLPAQYGKPLPEIPDGQDVIVVDFSWDREGMIELNERSNSLVVLDHHKTAEEELEGLDFATFDMNKCGAMLAWEYLFPDVYPPELVKYVQDRDLWNHDLPATKEINAYIRTIDWDYDEWSKLDYDLEFGFDNVVEKGAAILRAEKKAVEEIVKHKHAILVDKTLFSTAVNSSYYQSEIAHKLLEDDSYPTVAVVYYTNEDGDTVYSLRSVKEIDCSKIAKDFGGGGHPQASGFIQHAPPQILDIKL